MEHTLHVALACGEGDQRIISQAYDWGKSDATGIGGHRFWRAEMAGRLPEDVGF